MGGKTGKNRRGNSPVERLEHSHRRLTNRLNGLVEAAEHIAESDAACVAEFECVADVVAFLQRAVVRHEQDEEDSIFPRLQHVAELAGLLKQLAREHKTHRGLIEQLELTAAKRPLTAKIRSEIFRLAMEVQSLCNAHTVLEDRELLPHLEKYLSVEQMQAIAVEMADRRDR